MPDGEYEGVIRSAVVGLSKSESKRLQCVWSIEATGPEGFEGRKQTKIAGLETEDNLSWFQGDLAVLGIDPPEDETDIPAAVGETEGLPVAFRVRTNKEFTNVDFIGLLEGVDVEEAAEDGGNEEDGDDDELTADGVKVLGQNEDEDALQAIIDEYELDINQDDYITYAEVADLIIEALSL